MKIRKIFLIPPVVDVIKLIFGVNQIYPKAQTAKIGHFKSNKQFSRIVLLENSIVFTF